MIKLRAQFGLGILLTATAGYVDAVGFIELGGFFASFMSGASISLGVGLSEGHAAAVYHAGVLVGAFVVAATLSSLISEMMGLWTLAIVLLLEAICLGGAVAMIEAGWSSDTAIIPVVAAMGVQNTALQPIAGVRMGVTFMTGTLVSLSSALGRSLFRRAEAWAWVPHGLVWCSFVIGAAAGSFAYSGYGFAAIAAPAALVGILCALTGVSVLTARKRVERIKL